MRMRLKFNITEDYKKAYEALKFAYNQSNLKKEKVTLPAIDTGRAIDLTYCFLHLGEIYREEDMRKYYEKLTGINTWRQPRHLGTQFGWNHFIGGETLPNGYKLKNGEFCLWDVNNCKAGYNPDRRLKDPITNEEFEELKKRHNYCCANCGDREGTFSHNCPSKIVKLQKGHMDPNKPLTIHNCIPQCQCCNQGSINDWKYRKDGSIYTVNRPEVVMRNKDVEFRKALYKMLKDALAE